MARHLAHAASGGPGSSSGNSCRQIAQMSSRRIKVRFDRPPTKVKLSAGKKMHLAADVWELILSRGGPLALSASVGADARLVAATRLQRAWRARVPVCARIRNGRRVMVRTSGSRNVPGADAAGWLRGVASRIDLYSAVDDGNQWVIQTGREGRHYYFVPQQNVWVV